jgi:hypothetical protein
VQSAGQHVPAMAIKMAARQPFRQIDNPSNIRSYSFLDLLCTNDICLPM